MNSLFQKILGTLLELSVREQRIFDDPCTLFRQCMPLPELRGYHPQPLDLTSIRTKAERDV